MGNKLCKKKVDAVDNPKSPFDRIINRLHLRPHSWKSDSSLSDKQVNRYEINPKNGTHPVPPPRPRPLSSAKSADWTTPTLEVPSSNEIKQKKGTKIGAIFNDNSTPTPPPRKHKKGIREKLESVAKSGLQAFQSSKKPVEEPICIKRTIHYGCPGCDGRDKEHNHPEDAAHATANNVNNTNNVNAKDKDKENVNGKDKEKKRTKNLSIVSLPNYNELKLSVAAPDKSLKDVDASVNASHLSLPGEHKKLSTVSTPGKLENYMTRCRSFGSLLPNQLLNKLKPVTTPADVESDDSFGGLEDWDLRIIEHYNPKDASLPRPRKPIVTKNESAILQDIEGMIVKEEEIVPSPVPPVRRSESMVKKLTREARKSTEMLNHVGTEDITSQNLSSNETGRSTSMSITPPPSPEPGKRDNQFSPIPAKLLPTQDEEGKVEHSSLIKILEEFGPKRDETHKPTNPFLVEFGNVAHDKETQNKDEEKEKDDLVDVKLVVDTTEIIADKEPTLVENKIESDENAKDVACPPQPAPRPQAQQQRSSQYNAIMEFLYAERNDSGQMGPK